MFSRKLGIDKIAHLIKNKRVLIRVDYNVPMKNNIVTDDTKIRQSMQTIQFALENGAKNISLISHLGYPNDEIIREEASLKPIVEPLAKLLDKEVHFLNDCVGKHVINKVKNADGGKIFLLENLRFHPAEEGSYIDDEGEKIREKKIIIQNFRKELSQLGDIYVNDAFGQCNHAYSSMVGVNIGNRVAGFLLMKELEYLSKFFESPQKPVLAILGGSLLEDKINMINYLIERVDKMIITGGIAFTFLKAMNRMNIGKSIYDESALNQVDGIIKKAKEKNVQLIFPEDFVIAEDTIDQIDTKIVSINEGIPSDYLGIDTGPVSQHKFNYIIGSSGTILLKGLTGVIECNKAKTGSDSLIKSISAATKKGVITICGGSDTINLVNSNAHGYESFSHCCNEREAFQDLLEGKEFPGIKALSEVLI